MVGPRSNSQLGVHKNLKARSTQESQEKQIRQRSFCQIFTHRIEPNLEDPGSIDTQGDLLQHLHGPRGAPGGRHTWPRLLETTSLCLCHGVPAERYSIVSAGLRVTLPIDEISSAASVGPNCDTVEQVPKAVDHGALQGLHRLQLPAPRKAMRRARGVRTPQPIASAPEHGEAYGNPPSEA